MIPFFEPEDEVAAMSYQVPYMRCVGTKAVLCDNDFKTRMVFSELLQPSSRRIALTVILGLPVQVADVLGRRGNDFFAIGMDNDSSRSL